MITWVETLIKDHMELSCKPSGNVAEIESTEKISHDDILDAR